MATLVFGAALCHAPHDNKPNHGGIFPVVGTFAATRGHFPRIHTGFNLAQKLTVLFVNPHGSARLMSMIVHGNPYACRRRFCHVYGSDRNARENKWNRNCETDHSEIASGRQPYNILVIGDSPQRQK
jgi:hypothetical protein